MKTRNKNNKQYLKIKSVDYYWYHHMAVDWYMVNSINRAILEHDWALFQKAIKLFGSKYRYQTNQNGQLEKAQFTLGCTFPDILWIQYEDQETAEKEELLDCIPLTKRTFQFITHSECECG